MMRATRSSPSFRQKRTRTLIQAGGLLDKVGLLHAFNISLGDDLQDLNGLDEAATLLGFLKDKLDEGDFSPQNIQAWKTIGETVLKQGKK